MNIIKIKSLENVATLILKKYIDEKQDARLSNGQSVSKSKR